MKISRGNAWQSVGDLSALEDGSDLMFFTKGQFSLIDLIVACLDQTGPADVVVSTWTAARREIDQARALVEDERILSILWLVDFSFCRRQPAYATQLRERFGDGCIRSTANHAKFVLVRNGQWDLVVRTSMNLNKNRRLEYAEVSNDKAMADFFAQVVESIFEEQAPAAWIESRPGQVVKEFGRWGAEAGQVRQSPFGRDLSDPMKPGMSVWPKRLRKV